MIYSDAAFLHHVQQVIEILGTLAFAISGIRQAAYKHYDWFGGFVCGFAVAIGGGTLRDVYARRDTILDDFAHVHSVYAIGTSYRYSVCPLHEEA